MKPNTNKPKTGRRFRGLEVAQAALLLVLGVVVALALYFVMMDMISAAPVPDVQLDPYYSYVTPKFAELVLKFGNPGVVKRITIHDGINDNWLAECTPEWGYSFPFNVYPGREYNFICSKSDSVSWTPTLNVHVTFIDLRIVTLKWTIG
jgi:hypothetical protein